jgi:hypothetical protein
MSPFGIQISKEMLIYLHVKWIADRDRAIAALNGITKDEQIRRLIFGADYLQFMACLHGTSTVGIAASSSAAALLSVGLSRNPPSSLAGPSSASRAPAAQDTQRPSKKRRSNMRESIAVIDLCSP